MATPPRLGRRPPGAGPTSHDTNLSDRSHTGERERPRSRHDRDTSGKPPFPTFTCVYTAPTTGVSRGEQAYGELKRRLLHGDFALGSRLGEERLASLVGVSRTPVREALSRLHAEGFVVRLPVGGYAHDRSAV